MQQVFDCLWRNIRIFMYKLCQVCNRVSLNATILMDNTELPIIRSPINDRKNIKVTCSTDIPVFFVSRYQKNINYRRRRSTLFLFIELSKRERISNMQMTMKFYMKLKSVQK